MEYQTHLHLGAWHEDPNFGTTANPGIGVFVREDSFIAGAGVWRNSLKETAPYVFAGWQPANIGPVKIGGILGATKYKGLPRPVGGVLFTYQFKGSEWHFLATPRVKNYAPATIHLSTSF